MSYPISYDKDPSMADAVAIQSKTGLERPAGGDLEMSQPTVSIHQFAEVGQLKQGLHQRHIQMIALAGTIGTGLFLGSGRAIATAGPLGAWLGYTIVGAVACAVVLAVGEMGALLPLSGGYIRYSEFFLDSSVSFAQGWNLVYALAVAIPAELVAVSVLVEFWTTSVSSGVWITVFGIIMLVSALLFVRVYGELEFFFALLKIALIIGINVMALVITCGGGPDHKAIGFTFWKDPGPFVQFLDIPGPLGRFLGFWKTFSGAIYAYASIESITVAAAETKNPRQNIPKAAKRIFIRVLLFYCLTLFMVGLVVASDDPNLLQSTGTAAQSPFVIAARRAGIKAVPSIINGVVLTSAWSAGNSSLLTASRIMYGLASHGNAPKFFTKLNRFGIPYLAVAFYGVFMCLGYMTLSSSASKVFSWLQDLVAIATLINWIIIIITYLRLFYACRTQGINRHESFPWAAPFQPYLSWVALVAMVLILLTGGFSTFISGHWETETFVASYINIPFVILLFTGHKLVKKTKMVPLDKVPISELLAIALANPEPEEKKRQGIARLNILW